MDNSNHTEDSSTQQDDNDSPMQAYSDISSEQPPKAPKPPKSPRSRQKLLLIILLILLLIAAGVFAYIKFMKQSAPANDTQQQQAQPPVDEKIYFQLGSKIVEFTESTKTTASLTNELPAGAEVLDFYAASSTWRAIYRVNPEDQGEKFELVLLEKDKDPKTLVETTDFPFVAANAQHKLAVYTIAADSASGSGSAARSHTYVVKDGAQPEEIFTSNPYSQATPATDVKNYLYLVHKVSRDGKKALLNLHSCINCDGPPVASAFEIDIESKETELIQSSDDAGYVRFNSAKQANSGYKVVESNQLGLGADGPYELTIYSLDKPGGEAMKEFEATVADWINVVFSPNRQFLAAERRDKTYDVTNKTLFSGFYDISASKTDKDMKQLSVKDFPSDKFTAQNIGDLRGSCFGVALYGRAADQTTSTLPQQVGALCKDGENYSYIKADEAAQNDTNTASYIKVL